MVHRARTLTRTATANVDPAWFTGVMGSGILAICLTISPISIPHGRGSALILWSLDAVAFAVLLGLWGLQMLSDPQSIQRSLNDPATAQAWGAPPMAAFTIAVGFLKIGPAALDEALCVHVAQVLFLAGVVGSLFSAFTLPYLLFTHHEVTQQTTSGTWLLPVVPPIVASVPAALLASSWPITLRGDMLAFAYALLGTGISLAALVIVLFYARLTYHKVPDAPLVPSMWIVVGPLGQSIAGIIALGGAARALWPSIGDGLALAGAAYGVLVWGFAMYWLSLAIIVTLRAVRQRMSFSMGWWAFTFPVGVLTSGTDALFGVTHVGLFADAGLALLTLLVAMWAIVAYRTLAEATRAARTAISTAAVSVAVRGAISPARCGDDPSQISAR